MKKLILLCTIVILTIGVSGCMDNKSLHGTKNREKNDTEYAEIMLNYLEEKYDKEFEIVKCIFPKESFNSEHLKNYLLVRELETGMTTEVYSLLGTPYVYYDHYVSDLAAWKNRGMVSFDESDLEGKVKLYFYLRNEDIDSIDISTENMLRVVFVININHSPDKGDMEQLYEVYKQLFSLEYENIFMIIGFTEENSIFDNYVQHYRIYGVKEWQDYDGKVYATMDINESNLTFEEFENRCEFK